MRSLRFVSVFAVAVAGATMTAGAAVVSVNQVAANVASLGYSVMTIELEGSVYEIKALNASGAPVELHVNAVTGELIGPEDVSSDGDDDLDDVAENEVEDQSGDDDGPDHDVDDDEGDETDDADSGSDDGSDTGGGGEDDDDD